MASISVSFDTKTKKMTATVDGKAVADVVGVHFMPSWDRDDEYACELVTMYEDEDAGTKTVTRIVAAECEPDGRPVEGMPGFVSYHDVQSVAAKDIEKYFQK